MKIKEWFYLTLLRTIINNIDVLGKNVDKMTEKERGAFNRIQEELSKLK